MPTLFSRDSNNSTGPTVGDVDTVRLGMAQQKAHLEKAVAVGGPNSEHNKTALQMIGDTDKKVRELVAPTQTVEKVYKKPNESSVSVSVSVEASNNSPSIQ